MNERLNDEQLLDLLRQVDIQAMRIPPGVRRLADLICEKIMSEALPEGWKEATIAWEVCASIHREYAKKKDPFFTTRQADFVRHTEAARATLLAHIQRRAVPMKLNAGFYTLVAEKPFAEHDHPEWRHMYRIVADDNGRVLGYISDPSMLAAAPAPACTAPAPTEVPMPEPDATLHDDGYYVAKYHIRTSYDFGRAGWRLDVISMAKASTYGAAREAAGYARGLADAGRDAERRGQFLVECNDVALRIDPLGYGIYDAIDGDGQPYQSQALADEIAALRGEVK